ncbi:methyl-accepting chemotaxis protein [Piscinibacter gummiphilus]|uniref:Methyl-accepting chemotaxis protein n=1 Tax=Piscinibacter gummiphilus TaxID=946333 RepID=A0ABZ0CYU9_9BURK|nr:methyl-accepting chemotaxis protein [Piscinibacter gummiphilus]WOB10129.1 methyl-accepting chemotaxis protein [Piscinibacter gummiphilus]
MSQMPTEYVIDDGDLLVLVGDQASNIVYANPAYCKASGYDWRELKGTKAALMMHPANPPQILKDMGATMRLTRQPWTGIIKNRRKTGEYYWLRLNLAPIFHEGKFMGSLMVHSKPAPGEVAAIEPLYKRMLDGQHKDLNLRHGRVYRSNLIGKLGLWVREMGLKARLWGALGALDLAIAGALWAAGANPASWAFWASLGVVVAATGAAGAYLFHSIVKPLRSTVSLASRIAAGDLSAQVSSTRSDEIGAVLRALTQMNINLRATVSDVREGIGLMTRATAEIASGTQDLSARTESQASNLQETASSMEEMNATVRNNSDVARQASDVAAGASRAAETGGSAVGEVVATMDGISRSSKQIADIIGVIDSIAFQTNILALNAAVEAARAGEQGRGFAVVASEVRSLAQRSAQSAKEIRALISESVDQIDTGARLVNAAGSTINDVVAQVRRVNELVNHIAGASHEQSSGIEQINQAVTTLDHMTQQNAALVEQSTASAEHLREQAARMAEAMSVFKLSAADAASINKTAEKAVI